jgi:hypothetical protein
MLILFVLVGQLFSNYLIIIRKYFVILIFFKDLIVEMLTVLANYSITVEELKAIFNKLKGNNKYWVIISC